MVREVRVERWAIAVCVLLASQVGCSRHDSGRAGEAPGEAPEAVSVASGSVEVGVQRGSLRASVDVADFAITKFPIRVGDYAACVRAGACRVDTSETMSCKQALEESDPANVATCISPDQAVAYCGWVGGRLPSLGEWMAASRGPRVQQFAWGDTPPSCKQHWSGTCARRQKACDAAADPKGCAPEASFVTGKHGAGAAASGLQDVLLASGGELVAGDASGDLFGCPSAKTRCLVKSGPDTPSSIDYITVPAADPSDERLPRAERTFGFRCAWSEK